MFAQDIDSTALPRNRSPGVGCVNANFVLFAAALTISVLQLFIAPLILPIGAGTVFAIVALCAVSAPLHWGLMHESIHGNLFADPSANRRAGRLLGVLLCLSWDVMRFGHLLHHSANRHAFDRPEAVPPGGSRISTAGPYYLKLLGGHAVISSTSAIALALPLPIAAWLIEKIASGAEHAAMRSAAIRALTNAGRRRRIRVDLFAICTLLALATCCWRAHWPFLAASIAARFLALSLLDNAPHYGTALDSGTNARNTSLPRWVSWIVLEQNFHGIHHGSPGLRWNDLRQAFERSARSYDGNWLASVLRQFHGPLVFDSRVRR